MTDPNNYWQDKARKLVGKTVKEVRWLSPFERDASDWSARPPVIVFTDGSWVMPMMDDEGNNGGALAYSLAEGEQDTLPVM